MLATGYSISVPGDSQGLYSVPILYYMCSKVTGAWPILKRQPSLKIPSCPGLLFLPTSRSLSPGFLAVLAAFALILSSSFSKVTFTHCFLKFTHRNHWGMKSGAVDEAKVG